MPYMLDILKYKPLFEKIETPFYFYDTNLLQHTIDEVKRSMACIEDAYIHFAIKSNSNPTLLEYIAKNGWGTDCVSGNEITRSIQVGIDSNKIVFAGVGKTDKEINIALENNIQCFNVESISELDIINSLAKQKEKIARVAFRINPGVDAHTHKNITTGLDENKFGIDINDMLDVIKYTQTLSNVEYYGLHFHIGSQILDLTCYVKLCERINELQDILESHNIQTPSINVGGGLGIDYDNPIENNISDFSNYFHIFTKHLKRRPNQQLHFELGRSISGQCGLLISKVIYIKKTKHKQFAILDAGFTDFMRPTLYQAHHKIVNLSGQDCQKQIYDIVGPICESTDVFEHDYQIEELHRGDLVAFLSTGAYGHTMASTYNCRDLIKEYTLDYLLQSTSKEKKLKN